MKRLIDEISEKKLTREDTRDLTKMMKGKVKKLSFFVYNYAPKNKGKDTFRLRIEFKKQQVSKQEIIEVLEEILNKLKAQAE
jgi:hypothetical protein